MLGRFKVMDLGLVEDAPNMMYVRLDGIFLIRTPEELARLKVLRRGDDFEIPDIDLMPPQEKCD